jgi:hypothetical protein
MPFNVMGYGQGSSPFKAVDLVVSDEGNLAIANSADVATQIDLTAEPPKGEWFCLEWQVDFKSPEQVRVWLEGQESLDFSNQQPTLTDPRMEFFQVGPLFYYPGTNLPSFDMWADDVVVDTKRIGCP